MALDFNQLLLEMKQRNASDIHLKIGAVPVFRIYGELIAANHPPVTKEEILNVVEKIVPKRLRDDLKKDGAVDFGYSPDATTRFRTNVFFQRGSLSISMRRLEFAKISFQELNLPPILEKISQHRQGLVLVTGATGTGKTTTMAAIVDYVNSTRKEHIITIEDPIEFIHRDKMSLVEQRELGLDTRSFERALRDALREDPDVIVVGEMRDAETVTIAMRAAITGHLVISTLHTTNAIQTINRIVKYFAYQEQALMRDDLSRALRAVVSQMLIPAADTKGRVPAVEIMIANEMVRKLIREERFEDIYTLIKNRQDGMQSFDISVVELVRRKLITYETGLEYAEDKSFYKRNCAGIYAGDDRSRILSDI